MSIVESLGQLEVVGLREVWPDEARDFTPWLLDHAEVLADALGIDVELERKPSTLSAATRSTFLAGISPTMRS